MKKFQTVLVLVPLLATHALAAPYKSEIPELNVKVNLSLGEVAERVWKGISCLGTCRASWGWTGNHLGDDPWGGVLKAGDPLPYSEPGASDQTESSESSSSVLATSSDPGLNIQDVAEQSVRPTVSFSVFQVSTFLSYAVVR